MPQLGQVDSDLMLSSGLEAALEKLKKYSAQTGGKWLQVSPLLERLVAEGKGFANHSP
jgi:hypothetical protein